METPETIAVLGAGGTMGSAMTRNMARAGLDVRAWNRTGRKAEPLAGHGVRVAGTPAEAVRDAGIVVTMLADAGAVIAAFEDALPGIDAAAQPHAIWLQMSTIGEAATRRCENLANSSGIGFVDAPVLGTREPAERGELVILESGPEEARSRTQPVFDAVGHRVIRAGQAGAGTRLKIVVNSWVLSVVEAGAETIALAEGLGIDPDLFFKTIEGGTLDLPYLRTKGSAIAARDFTPPSFRLALAAKDATLVAESALVHGLDLPLFDTIAERLLDGALEHGDEDFSATYLTSTPDRAA
jgi:3-hydroxyisobutyrate dehydrogenase